MKSSLVALSLGFLPAAVTAVPTVATAPAVESPAPEVPYSYNPVLKRDPFRNPLNSACCLPPSPPTCNEPLCDYDLDQLTLSGVVSGLANPVAVLESPRGQSYRIYRGSKVGRNGGVVKQVRRDSIVVAEITRDGQGQPLEYETIIRMRPDLPMTLEE